MQEQLPEITGISTQASFVGPDWLTQYEWVQNLQEQYGLLHTETVFETAGPTDLVLSADPTSYLPHFYQNTAGQTQFGWGYIDSTLTEVPDGSGAIAWSAPVATDVPNELAANMVSTSEQLETALQGQGVVYSPTGYGDAFVNSNEFYSVVATENGIPLPSVEETGVELVGLGEPTGLLLDISSAIEPTMASITIISSIASQIWANLAGLEIFGGEAAGGLSVANDNLAPKAFAA